VSDDNELRCDFDCDACRADADPDATLPTVTVEFRGPAKGDVSYLLSVIKAARQVDEIREVARRVGAALAFTYLTVPQDGRPHWCDWTDRHEPTCAGMLVTEDDLREVLSRRLP
jgi:hypothetical protein